MNFNDYKRYTSRTGLVGILYAYLMTANYRVIFWFRIRVALKRVPILSTLCDLIFWKISFDRGLEIPSTCKIKEGFYVIHSGVGVVNSKAEIGKNFTAVSSFNIGGVLEGPNKGAPKLGDNVYLGSGVVIIGNISIGDNVLVGANSVVLSDVPANSFVAGAPAKVISNAGSQKYIIRPL